MIAASSVASPMLCSAATNMSMNVPEVVKMTMRMMANIATDGPDSQSHALTPRKLCSVSAAGPFLTPNAESRMWTMPRGSLNQFGPLTPNHLSIALMGPAALNRNSHSTVIATELVTDGK